MKIENPPAYPSGEYSVLESKQPLHDGATLLDYYAVHSPHDLSEAISSTKAAADYIGIALDEYMKSPRTHWNTVEAKLRFEYARAMLIERQKVLAELNRAEVKG